MKLPRGLSGSEVARFLGLSKRTVRETLFG